MKVAIVVETFARDMGYINNTFPKYLARAGVDVHVVTTDLSPYHQLGSAVQVFGRAFAERNLNEPDSCERLDGYTLHTLPHRNVFGYPRAVGLAAKLAAISPDIVCIFQAAGWIPLDCARLQRRLGYRLIVGSHMGKTVFRMPGGMFSPRRVRSFLLRTLPGWFIASRADGCVVPTIDCAEVVADHFGIPANIVSVMNLPVDTDFFYPDDGPLRPALAAPSNRMEIRTSLGISESDFLCVYSGKFTIDKNAIVLAQATDILRSQGHAVSALFIGAGPQEELIRASSSAIVLPFMPVSRLGDYYRAADAGVWMNESISFLDGASCGLPLILSDEVKDISHLQEFTSIFRAGDAQSLADQIKLVMEPALHFERRTLAAELAHRRFSGPRYAQMRMDQFSALLPGEQRAA